MLLDVLDDVFLLNSSLEATERTFDRFSVLDSYFGQPDSTPLPNDEIDVCEPERHHPNILSYHRWALVLGPKPSER